MATSITVLVRSQQPENMFGPYTGEMLRAEGISDYQIVDMDTAEDWLNESSSLVIVTRCHLRMSEQERLLDYVRQGGRLIVFRPSGKLRSAPGLAARYKVTCDPYLMPDADHPVTRGLPQEAIQCHWVTVRYGLGRIAGGAEIIAQDFSDPDSPTGYAAVIAIDWGAGKIGLCFYDPPASVARIRFGNPDLASTNTMGLPAYSRACDLFAGYFDPSRGHLPQADLHCNLLSNLIQYLSPQPVPRLWYYRTPQERSALPIESDDDHSTPEQFEALREGVEKRDGRCAFYLMRDTKLPDSEVRRYLERGHSFGYHSNPRSDEDPYFAVPEILASDAEAFRQRYGFTARTTQLHSAYWRGYMGLVPVFHEIGLRMGVTYGSYLDWFGMFVTGSSRPMKFIDEFGKIHHVFQQSTPVYDDASIQKMLTEHADREIAKVAKTLDACVNIHHSPIGFSSHPLSFATYSEPFIGGVMDEARTRGMPILSMDQWYEFTQMRYDAQLVLVDASDSCTECELTAGATAGQLTVMVPIAQGSRAAGAKVDGEAVSVESLEVLGWDYALVPVELRKPGERRRIRVEYRKE